MDSENWHLLVFDVLILLMKLSDLLLLFLVHLQLCSLTSGLEREDDALLDSLGDFVGDKVSVLTVSTIFSLLSHLLLLHRAFLEACFKNMEVIVDVVIFVHIDVVLRRFRQPILVHNSLASRIKLNELLELEVGASVSVCEPIDGLFLDYQTEEHGGHGEVIVILVRWSTVYMFGNIFIEPSEEGDKNVPV